MLEASSFLSAIVEDWPLIWISIGLPSGAYDFTRTFTPLKRPSSRSL